MEANWPKLASHHHHRQKGNELNETDEPSGMLGRTQNDQMTGQTSTLAE